MFGSLKSVVAMYQPLQAQKNYYKFITKITWKMMVPEAGVWRCSVKLLKFSENYLKSNHDRLQCFWMPQITHHRESLSLIFCGAPVWGSAST